MQVIQNRRLIRTVYAVRTVSFLYCLLVVGLHLAGREVATETLLLLVLQFVVYPHLLYLRAKHSPQPLRAMRDNLLIDSTLLGAWCAWLGFPLWIAYAFASSTVLNAVVNRGAAGSLLSIACSAAGAGVVIGIAGLRLELDTGPLVSALCFGGSLAYAVAVGYVVFRQNRRIAATRTKMAENERRFRLIAQNAADLIGMIDPDGRWLYASPSYERMLDAPGVAIGVDAFARAHPDDAEQARRAVTRAAGTGKAREFAMRLIDRDGRVRQLRSRVQAIQEGEEALPDRAESGAANPIRIVIVSQDVTDLRESEEKLLLAAHALEGMTEAILITAADGTVVTVNRAFTEITGYPREEVLGQNETAIRNALQPPEYYVEIYARVREEGYWSGTTWSKRKNGSVYREWRSVRAVRDAGGAPSHFVIVFYEVGNGGGAVSAAPLKA